MREAKMLTEKSCFIIIFFGRILVEDNSVKQKMPSLLFWKLLYCYL